MMAEFTTSNLSVLLVENETLTAERIRASLRKMGYTEVAHVTSYTDALARMEQHTPDLLLLDIDLGKGPDGIELARHVQGQHPIPVIFLTQFEFADYEGRLHGVHRKAFLRKNFYVDSLHAALAEAVEQKNPAKAKGSDSLLYTVKDKFFLYNDDQFQRYAAEKLLFIKGAEGYSDLVFEDRLQAVVVSMNLSRVVKKLGYPPLMRAHRSYYVNLNHIEKIIGNMLIVGGQEIPMGPKYREKVLERLRLIQDKRETDKNKGHSV
ncbi:MAG TPA: hypothetical protein DCE41_37685 [Cytophagales bacterium]|nr:hypothetical protein [Cytophagales bacterium]HAA22355.1 hypothetical protein [Cytophagales bacterium]HAP62178.1 hypothetical protein [Cytophagales bacterium]